MKKKKQRHQEGGFTLIELLVVMTIMSLVLLTAIGVGTLNSGTLAGSTGTISRVFEQARTYAMSNHTYVMVGITEVAANSYTPNHALTLGTGCVVVEIVATEDGTNNSTRTVGGSTVPNLVPVDEPYILNNLHLVDLSTKTTGNMIRPAVSGVSNLTASTPSVQTPTSWPQSSFNGIFVNFDPQGSAHTLTSATSNPISNNAAVPLIELGIQESHGAFVTPTSSDLKYAALQIEGISGVNHLYQP